MYTATYECLILLNCMHVDVRYQILDIRYQMNIKSYISSEDAKNFIWPQMSSHQKLLCCRIG
jgi:hypothetical protein